MRADTIFEDGCKKYLFKFFNIKKDKNNDYKTFYPTDNLFVFEDRRDRLLSNKITIKKEKKSYSKFKTQLR